MWTVTVRTVIYRESLCTLWGTFYTSSHWVHNPPVGNATVPPFRWGGRGSGRFQDSSMKSKTTQQISDSAMVWYSWLQGSSCCPTTAPPTHDSWPPVSPQNQQEFFSDQLLSPTKMPSEWPTAFLPMTRLTLAGISGSSCSLWLPWSSHILTPNLICCQIPSLTSSFSSPNQPAHCCLPFCLGHIIPLVITFRGFPCWWNNIQMPTFFIQSSNLHFLSDLSEFPYKWTTCQWNWATHDPPSVQVSHVYAFIQATPSYRQTLPIYRNPPLLGVLPPHSRINSFHLLSLDATLHLEALTGFHLDFSCKTWHILFWVC